MQQAIKEAKMKAEELRKEVRDYAMGDVHVYIMYTVL